MPTFKRLAVYLIIYFLTLAVIAIVTDFWKFLDYGIYKTFYLDAPEKANLRKDIAVIDIPYLQEGSSAYNRANYRQRLIDLLQTINEKYESDQRPKAVVLDIFFRNDAVELEALKTALQQLKGKVKVYGVYDMRDAENTYFESHDAKQAQEIYEYNLEGYRLHTIFEERMGIFSYDSELGFTREHGGEERIEALALRVARDINNIEAPPNPSRGYILPVGTPENIQSQTYTFSHDANQASGGQFSADLDMSDKIIIVGSLKEDHIKEVNQTGTHLLAWALNDQLKGNTLAKQPLINTATIIGMLLFFSLFSVLIFALLYKYVKRLQTQPAITALVAFFVSTAVLMLTGLSILAMGKVIPVGLSIIGMIVALYLAYRFTLKFLVTGVAEGSQKYDVFISYSHGNSEWVVKHVYEPLSAFRKPNGDSLEIFFDKDSIDIGEAFTSKYMWAIVDSKVFIPVISEEYYKKNHCRNEMDLAYKRFVEKLLHIIPIAFSFEAVPQIYNHINFTDITVNPDFIEDVIAEITKTEDKEG